MNPIQPNSSSTTGPGGPLVSRGRKSSQPVEQLALPLTDAERADSRRQLAKLHPGNRFRLMFGQPLLQESASSGESR
jgi:hypothetical protein